MICDLVYDVGMCDATDTSYYLKLGYRVVAVEADPTLCETARLRFRRECENGQLIIVNRAVVEDPGPSRTVSLYVNPHIREWNTVLQDHAERKQAYDRIEVPCARFEEILAEYGVPYYLKVDIEGMDRFCALAIDAENRPAYVSVEFSEDSLLDILISKGYRRFKAVRQTDLVGLRDGMVPDIGSSRFICWLRQRPSRIRGKVIRLTMGRTASRAKKISKLADGSTWFFHPTSSGPFGELSSGGGADGTWFKEHDFRSVWKPWRDSANEAGENWPYWFDLHATT